MGKAQAGNEEDKVISSIIQSSLVESYGINGYKSIIQIMIKHCGQTEKNILEDYKLFEELIQGIFGELGNAKILEPIKSKINEIKNDHTLDGKKMQGF